MAAPGETVPYRGMITVCVMLATIMQALDTTIANIALPYMQGNLGANQDQINWVLTSYIVAAAIMTPVTGALVSRIGRKNLFIVSVIGFVVASVLCGLAQNVTEIVGFRLLQGVFGAPLVPLSQATVIDINPPERRGQAMAIWGVGVMVGPILGPVLGGWLTDHYSWRWVFYINVPIGALALAGMLIFMPDSGKQAAKRFDWLGFFFLSLGIGALQMMLDRGQDQDWFNSLEIIIELVLAALGFYLFVVHLLTADAPFVRPALFTDRNFVVAMVVMAIVGSLYYSIMALATPFLQTMLGYPVVTAGLVMGPRGIGTMVAMMVVGRLIGKVDTRILLLVGLAMIIGSLWRMSGYSLDVSMTGFMIDGLVQGAGLGLVFVPLSTMAFSTLPRLYLDEGAGIYSVSRNLGSSIGISIVTALLTRNIQTNHQLLGEHVTAFSPAVQQLPDMMSPDTLTGRAMLDQLVNQQASLIAYIDDFKLLMVLAIAAIPLLVLLRRPKGGGSAPAVSVHAD
ncbi:MAG: DHA2 family efflux MFS transporter permease subunit [Inquilinus limosus]|uniref:DHA2 family efflux MFS transporter permease subunit n=1 Tax=Inquilinus limosus TaxID=171674 RepID=A0A952FL65_9PROT|nr:DHA2 family efflux MFS transporter permease subunit [Inquilinus limosus]